MVSTDPKMEVCAIYNFLVCVYGQFSILPCIFFRVMQQERGKDAVQAAQRSITRPGNRHTVSAGLNLAAKGKQRRRPLNWKIQIVLP